MPTSLLYVLQGFFVANSSVSSPALHSSVAFADLTLPKPQARSLDAMFTAASEAEEAMAGFIIKFSILSPLTALSSRYRS